jgi:hypothetical protein
MRTLKHKEGLHNYTHRKGCRTTDVKVINLDILTDTPGLNTIKKKFKFSYECYNAGEDFTGELFDGTKLNPVFEITDLGVTRDCSAYHIPTEDQLKTRIEMLTNKGIEFIKSLY